MPVLTMLDQPDMSIAGTAVGEAPSVEELRRRLAAAEAAVVRAREALELAEWLREYQSHE